MTRTQTKAYLKELLNLRKIIDKDLKKVDKIIAGLKKEIGRKIAFPGRVIKENKKDKITPKMAKKAVAAVMKSKKKKAK